MKNNHKFLSINGIFLLMLLLVSPWLHAEAETHTLSARHQAIIPIAAFTAVGDLQRLEPALHQGLEDGLSVNEIKEIFIHSYAYVGFPRSLNGINTFIKVMDERQRQGLTDIVGKQASQTYVIRRSRRSQCVL